MEKKLINLIDLKQLLKGRNWEELSEKEKLETSKQIADLISGLNQEPLDEWRKSDDKDTHMKKLSDVEKEALERFNDSYVYKRISDRYCAVEEISAFYRQAIIELLEKVVGDDYDWRTRHDLDDYNKEEAYDQAKAEIRERIKKIMG